MNKIDRLVKAIYEKYKNSPEDLDWIEKVLENLLEEPISTW